MLLVQAQIGTAAWQYLVPIAVIVCVLLAIVVTSYRQTIFAYPSGGGSYIVSRENLGAIPSLVAGSSLLVDYILTVAVSVAGGVLAIRSAAGFNERWTVPICLLCVLLMTVANLRGVKESGGALRRADLLLHRHAGAADRHRPRTDLRLQPRARSRTSPSRVRRWRTMNQSLSFIMLLRAFSSGAVALSGVEAISNGVPAFRKPESHNAATTLIVDGHHPRHDASSACRSSPPTCSPTAASRAPPGSPSWPRWIYSGKGVLFWMTQIATFAILILAANTAYADFPRLSSIIARDGFLPRQFSNRGDRLVFSNGIIFLAVMAGVLIVVFDGNISALIPLYAFGVFTGFTLSQAGMVVHHYRLKEPGWRLSAPINGIGASPPASSPSSSWSRSSPRARGSPPSLIPIMVIGFCCDRQALPAGSTPRCTCRPATGRRATPTTSSCSSAA